MTYAVKLPDVGEGVAEAELVEWHVAVGDEVTPDTVLAEVLTDKATVEIFPPVAGTVRELHGHPGDTLPVGGVLVTLDTTPTPPTASKVVEPVETAGDHPRPAGPKAAPAVRARARDRGIDLATVTGTGPDGVITHADLDRLSPNPNISISAPAREPAHTEPVRGLRRRISERLTEAWQRIPHITYVEAVDATELEALRTTLNGRRGDGQPKLTLLPFIARAIVRAVAQQPRLNAHHEDGNLTVFEAVHVGIATQTDAGLVVPVVRHAERRSLAELAAEIARLANAAREGKATREELAGSTITITSLGALGGLVTTPIVNAPEVAIVGINKIETRPVWRDGAFIPRQVFNISASFDHRIVDGWDAATFVQQLKQLLEQPALLFVDA